MFPKRTIRTFRIVGAIALVLAALLFYLAFLQGGGWIGGPGAS